MDEKTAWTCFQKTGSIEAYIRYTQLKNQRLHAYPAEQEPDPEGSDADLYGRPDYSGTGHW